MKILSADYVLPISSDPITDGAVAVQEDTIADVGKTSVLRERYPDSKCEDFGNAVLMPGLVNAHAHLELTVLRGYLDRFDADFGSWLIALTRARSERLSDDDIFLSALIGAIEGIKAGITTFADIGRFGKAGFEALSKTGLRGILFQETEFSPDERNVEADFESLAEKFYDLKSRETKLVRTGISPHSPYTVSKALFERIAEFSAAENVPLTIHASESRDEAEFLKSGSGLFAGFFEKQGVAWTPPNCSTVEYLSDIGVLDAKPLLAHCVLVSDRDIDLIAASGSKIVHCPKSNARFGHGIAPLWKFVESGADVGLGSDSVASNNVCDLFEEGRIASLFSRVGNKNAGFIDSQSIIELATIGGAKAVGIGDSIGTLELGKQADIIAVSLDKTAQNPVYDPCSALVFATNSRDVIFTMVAGRVLYRRGELYGTDGDEAAARLKEISGRLMEG